jgi:hypothetical protein
MSACKQTIYTHTYTPAEADKEVGEGGKSSLHRALRKSSLQEVPLTTRSLEELSFRTLSQSFLYELTSGTQFESALHNP